LDYFEVVSFYKNNTIIIGGILLKAQMPEYDEAEQTLGCGLPARRQ
jgi:hypothetical protein